MNGNVQNQNFFNFVADAVGYLNEIKVVHPENGDAYVAVKAAILEGKPKNGKIKQIYIDLNVKGQQALDVINALRDYWPGYGSTTDHKWMAGIRFGSINAKTYFSKKANSQVAMLTGSLIAFRWLKINGQDVAVPEWHKQDPQMQPQMQQAPQMQPQMRQAPQMQPQMQQAPQMQPQMQQAPQMPLQAPQILQ